MSIECWKGRKGGIIGKGEGSGRGCTEKGKLEMLFGIWKEEKPDDCNIHKLKSVLAEEVILDAKPTSHIHLYILRKILCGLKFCFEQAFEVD